MTRTAYKIIGVSVIGVLICTLIWVHFLNRVPQRDDISLWVTRSDVNRLKRITVLSHSSRNSDQAWTDCYRSLVWEIVFNNRVDLFTSIDSAITASTGQAVSFWSDTLTLSALFQIEGPRLSNVIPSLPRRLVHELSSTETISYILATYQDVPSALLEAIDVDTLRHIVDTYLTALPLPILIDENLDALISCYSRLRGDKALACGLPIDILLERSGLKSGKQVLVGRDASDRFLRAVSALENRHPHLTACAVDISHLAAQYCRTVGDFTPTPHEDYDAVPSEQDIESARQSLYAANGVYLEYMEDVYTYSREVLYTDKYNERDALELLTKADLARSRADEAKNELNDLIRAKESGRPREMVDWGNAAIDRQNKLRLEALTLPFDVRLVNVLKTYVSEYGAERGNSIASVAFVPRYNTQGVGSNAPSGSDDEDQDVTESAEWTTINIKEQMGSATCEISYPKITAGQSSVYGVINDSIEAEIRWPLVYGLETNPQSGSLRESVLQWLLNSDTTAGWKSITSVRVIYYQHNAIATERYYLVDDDGSRPKYAICYSNYSLKTGRKLKLSDVLVPGHETALDSLGELAFRMENEIPAGSSLSEAGFSFENNRFSTTDNFAIQETGLQFLFQPYEVDLAPMNYTVSYEELVRRQLIRKEEELGFLLTEEALTRDERATSIGAQRIQFTRGATTWTTSERLFCGTEKRFALHARAGQWATFKLLNPYGLSTAVFSLSDSQKKLAVDTTEWSGTLEITGDYKLAVSCKRIPLLTVFENQFDLYVEILP